MSTTNRNIRVAAHHQGSNDELDKEVKSINYNSTSGAKSKLSKIYRTSPKPHGSGRLSSSHASSVTMTDRTEATFKSFYNLENIKGKEEKQVEMKKRKCQWCCCCIPISCMIMVITIFIMMVPYIIMWIYTMTAYTNLHTEYRHIHNGTTVARKLVQQHVDRITKIKVEGKDMQQHDHHQEEEVYHIQQLPDETIYAYGKLKIRFPQTLPSFITATFSENCLDTDDCVPVENKFVILGIQNTKQEYIDKINYSITVSNIKFPVLFVVAILGVLLVTLPCIGCEILVHKKIRSNILQINSNSKEDINMHLAIDGITYAYQQVVKELLDNMNQLQKFIPKYAIDPRIPDTPKDDEQHQRAAQRRFAKTKFTTQSVISRVSSFSQQSGSSTRSMRNTSSMGLTYRDITVVYIKWTNMHEIRQILGKEEMTDLVNDISEMLEQCISGRKGLVQRLNEMDVVGSYNTHLECVPHCSNACRSALDIEKKLKVINEQLEGLDTPSVNLSIGISTSNCYFGILGATNNKSFHLFGDALVYAEALSNYTHIFPTTRQITISQDSMEIVKDTFVIRPLELIGIHHLYLRDGEMHYDILYELNEERIKKHDEWLYEVARDKREKRYDYYIQAFAHYRAGEKNKALQALDEHQLHFDNYMKNVLKDDDTNSLKEMGLTGSDDRPLIHMDSIIDGQAIRLKKLLEKNTNANEPTLHITNWYLYDESEQSEAIAIVKPNYRFQTPSPAPPRVISSLSTTSSIKNDDDEAKENQQNEDERKENDDEPKKQEDGMIDFLMHAKINNKL